MSVSSNTNKTRKASKTNKTSQTAQGEEAMSVSTKKTSKTAATQSANTALATKAKALIGQAITTLAPGEPLSTKDRREVIIRSIRTTPAMVTAAAATYAEHTDMLGSDLDPSAALDAQDYVTQLTPIVTELRTFARALEERIHEHDATAADFAETVYDRAQAMSRMPQGSALGSRITQLEDLRVKRRKAKKTEDDSGDGTAAGTEVAATTAAPATAATPATVVVNTAK